MTVLGCSGVVLKKFWQKRRLGWRDAEALDSLIGFGCQRDCGPLEEAGCQSLAAILAFLGAAAVPRETSRFVSDDTSGCSQMT
jgi:hypothetical protein